MMVVGPGHGGPAAVANAYLEGTWSERYSSVGPGEDGMRTLFREFSFPGGVGSHVTPEVPGSIHEGGELGYSLTHAFGAAFDNPGLVVFCVVGDGEAETGPLATSWHSNKFLNPARDGAVLPILHLNGYKIAGATVLARIRRARSWGSCWLGLRLPAVPPDRRRATIRRALHAADGGDGGRASSARSAPSRCRRRNRPSPAGPAPVAPGLRPP